MKEQIKRLPKMPIWYDKDMFISFTLGLIIGFLLNWII